MAQEDIIKKFEDKIAQLKKETEQYYSMIGRKYYALHSSDAEEGVRTEIEKINELNLQITYEQEQMAAYKEGRICVNCGASLSEEDRFCPSCGKQIERTKDISGAQKKICARCGNPYEQGQKFCVKCGFSLLDLKNEEKIIEKTPEIPKKLICPGCGSEVEPDMKFCIVCGKKLR